MATDNALFTILVAQIESFMNDKSLPVSVQQGYQQALQGIDEDGGEGSGDLPQVFLYKLRDHRYGSKKIDPVYDGPNTQFNMNYIQQMETTFQCSVLRRQEEGNPDALTASDYLNEVAEVLQCPEFQNILWKDHQVGIQRVIELPSSYMID